MRFFSLLVLFGFLLVACQDKGVEQTTVQVPTDFYDQLVNYSAGYDSLFASKVGADEYGMSQYVMAFLKRGPNRDRDSLEAAELQRAHLQNINRMAEEGKLVVAGPFLDNGDIRGIYIFNVKTVEEAQALTESDPAIQAGSLVMELHPWYGSACLPLLLPLHKRLEEKNVAE
ncbi:MAG: YciI family protein [Saprospiraceae bacterium]